MSQERCFWKKNYLLCDTTSVWPFKVARRRKTEKLLQHGDTVSAADVALEGRWRLKTHSALSCTRHCWQKPQRHTHAPSNWFTQVSGSHRHQEAASPGEARLQVLRLSSSGVEIITETLHLLHWRYFFQSTQGRRIIFFSSSKNISVAVKCK